VRFAGLAALLVLVLAGPAAAGPPGTGFRRGVGVHTMVPRRAVELEERAGIDREAHEVEARRRDVADRRLGQVVSWSSPARPRRGRPEPASGAASASTRC
jgi:hypothetical protein